MVELAYALSGNRAGAEDIAQEAFLRAHRDWHRVGSYQHPGAWVRRVAANLATSALRRRLIEARALARAWAELDGAGRLQPLPGRQPDRRGTGRVVRVTGSGLHPVATGLSFPTGLATGPDGHLHVSEHGYGGDPAAGRILRIRLPG